MCYCTLLYQHPIALLLLLLLVLLQKLLLLHVQLLLFLHLLMLLHGRRVNSGLGPVRVGLRTGRAPGGVGAGGQEVACVDLLLPAVVRRRRVHELLAELLLLLLLLLLREVEPLLLVLRGNRRAPHGSQVRRARGQLRG